MAAARRPSCDPRRCSSKAVFYSAVASAFVLSQTRDLGHGQQRFQRRQLPQQPSYGAACRRATQNVAPSGP